MTIHDADPQALIPDAAVDALRAADAVTVFTGAGMSAESGVPTFRDAHTGLWERFDPALLATVGAWERDPDMIWAFYQWRARMVRVAQPNAGHHSLAHLAADVPTSIVTQNIDDLHERAGSTDVSHLHGSLFNPICAYCGRPYRGLDADPDRAVEQFRVEPPICPVCLGSVRPGVVWFGENLPERPWMTAESAMLTSDVVVVVGTSGVVYPAASLPEMAAAQGVPVLEINPETTPLSPIAQWSVRTTAAKGLPELVARRRDQS
ncbi:SIR2 family NAD-dependent protein deacylase [Williamsia sterculiae]|uniref:NAD-dependent protein deacylase n=1 Tax=Williamsia sterculiae TaxID=1344003 RepID=A0A1N7GKT4_9NOCA|nr:NAD-dependent protein deacylase [Williamsia sterculiae]SIS13205.1 NAD-dependent deacetylase [Williamsia sterculiae]